MAAGHVGPLRNAVEVVQLHHADFAATAVASETGRVVQAAALAVVVNHVHTACVVGLDQRALRDCKQHERNEDNTIKTVKRNRKAYTRVFLASVHPRGQP